MTGLAMLSDIVLASGFGLLCAYVATRPVRRFRPEDFERYWSAVDSNGVFRPERAGRPARSQPQAYLKAPPGRKGGHDVASV